MTIERDLYKKFKGNLKSESESKLLPLIRTALQNENCWFSQIQVKALDDPRYDSHYELSAEFHPSEQETIEKFDKSTEKISSVLRNLKAVEDVGYWTSYNDETGAKYVVLFSVKSGESKSEDASENEDVVKLLKDFLCMVPGAVKNKEEILLKLVDIIGKTEAFRIADLVFTPEFLTKFYREHFAAKDIEEEKKALDEKVTSFVQKMPEVLKIEPDTKFGFYSITLKQEYCNAESVEKFWEDLQARLDNEPEDFEDVQVTLLDPNGEVLD